MLEWNAKAADLAAEYRAQWSLSVIREVHNRPGGLVQIVQRDNGEQAVLKLAYPERQTVAAPEALRQWDGDGAVRLILADPTGTAALVEACLPGHLSYLSEAKALTVAGSLIGRLHLVDPGVDTFLSLDEEVLKWVDRLLAGGNREGPEDADLSHVAVSLASDLLRSKVEPRLLHGDFSTRNILPSTREPWLAIDPQPLIGDPAFDTARLIRDEHFSLYEDPDLPRRLQYRLGVTADVTGLDRARIRDWAVFEAITSAQGTGPLEGNMRRCARSLLQLT